MSIPYSQIVNSNKYKYQFNHADSVDQDSFDHFWGESEYQYHDGAGGKENIYT